MTFAEAYTSLKSLYKQMMFPKNADAPKWTLSEIDSLDAHFFYELMDSDETPQEKEVYLADVW